MGLFDFVKKIGKGIGSVAKGVGKFVGDVVKDPKKIGSVIKALPGAAQKLLDYGAGNIPIIGTGIAGIAKAGNIAKIGEKLIKGDVGGALKEGADIAVSASPIGQIKRAERIGRDIARLA